MFGASIPLKKASRLLGVWPTLITVLTAASLLVALSADHLIVAGIAVVIPPLVIAWRQRRTLFARPRGAAVMRRYAVARYVSLAAVAALAYRHGEWSFLWLIIIALFVITLELERSIQTLSRFTKVYATNFPGPEQRVRAAFKYGIVYQLGLAALVLLALAPSLPRAAAWLCLILGLVIVGVGLFAVKDCVDRIRARHAFQKHLPEALEELEPVFYLYWQAAPGSGFQIAMWLPYLDRLGVPYAVVVRTAANFREASRLTERPILYRQYMTDLEETLVPSLRGVFYVNGSIRNNHLTRYAHLTHIQLNHGESDKAPSTNPVIRMFDLNFVAGQAAIDRFAQQGVAMPREMFRIVGRPQVEDVEAQQHPITGLDAPTVLYAPTWEGYHEDARYSSLLSGTKIVQNLLDRGCTVVFRPHPYCYRTKTYRQACVAIKKMLRADAEITGREHLCGYVAEKEMSIVDCFNASDAMISDVSSVVGDYLFSRKPLAMVSTRHTREEFRSEFPMARAAYVLDATGEALGNLDEMLEDLLVEDPLAQTRASLATYYLGDIPREDYAQRFIDVAREELGVGIGASHG